MFKKKRFIVILLAVILFVSNTPTIGHAATNSVNTLKKQITSLQKQVSTLTASNSKLQKDNEGLKEQLAVYKKTVSQLREGMVKFEEGTVWKGTYSANQGETGVTLTVKKTTVEFSFYPTTQNPNVPSGKFMMFIDHDEETGALSLKGDKWIDRPNNYNMVNLIGSISGDYINGVVVVTNSNQVSGKFNVKKEK